MKAEGAQGEVLKKLKHYVFPENPLDARALSRLKRGAINYAQVNSWWPIPPLQRWIRNHRFQFCHGHNGTSTLVEVSGGDITHLWVADEVLLEHVYNLEAVPFVPDLVLDLGANIGLFTLLAARRWPKANLVCVEPHPTTFSFLCDNLTLNQVPAVKLQCALDAVTGMKSMRSMWSECGEGAVYQGLSSEGGSIQVMTLPLEALLPPDTGTKLLIKMDIEGSEMPVLDGLKMALPENTFIYIELHEGEKSARWISDWAARHDFEFTRVRGRWEELAVDGYLSRPGRSLRA